MESAYSRAAKRSQTSCLVGGSVGLDTVGGAPAAFRGSVGVAATFGGIAAVVDDAKVDRRVVGEEVEGDMRE